MQANTEGIDTQAFEELDDEIKQEFFEDVVAAIADVNECASILEAGADAQVIDRMFRSLHTVKGNCKMVFLDSFVEASHKLEDLFSKIRSGQIEYHDTYGEFAVVVINEIQKQLEKLIQRQSVSGMTLTSIENLISQIESVDSSERLGVAERAVIAVKDGHYNVDLVAVDNEHGRAFSFMDATDLEFFEFISDKQAQTDSSHEKFLHIVNDMALSLNQMLNRKVEEDQLKAAITFLTLSNKIRIEESPADLTMDQVFFASGLLARMPGWSIASDLILQSLESHDGSGHPNGLAGDEIPPAAQVLGLAFEFGYIILNSESPGYKESLFSAVKVINAKKDSRYKARQVERFNDLIKSEYLTEQRWF
ncbi:Hpt domain-containing protein [Aliikangiella sp. G2MR2-5]|uniref:Hpt domain-containing protein n=1 Tax=Aliikangiella sp. G2MR2-5 TaxID=2788943 RepID=UPI0018ABC54D|nr:Hpt domain-containing protein [Aliikangiella sp. G2MR2-5]